MIAGAGLDVTNPEPPSPDSPLLKLDQVLVTGHFAYYSETSVRELHVKSAEAIVCRSAGRIPAVPCQPGSPATAESPDSGVIYDDREKGHQHWL